MTSQTRQRKLKGWWTWTEQEHKYYLSLVYVLISYGRYIIGSWQVLPSSWFSFGRDGSFLVRMDDWVIAVFSFGKCFFPSALGGFDLYLTFSIRLCLTSAAASSAYTPRSPLHTDLGPHGSPCQPTAFTSCEVSQIPIQHLRFHRITWWTCGSTQTFCYEGFALGLKGRSGESLVMCNDLAVTS